MFNGHVTQSMISVLFKNLENIVKKEEKADYPAFSPLQTMFAKSFMFHSIHFCAALSLLPAKFLYSYQKDCKQEGHTGPYFTNLSLLI